VFSTTTDSITPRSSSDGARKIASRLMTMAAGSEVVAQTLSVLSITGGASVFAGIRTGDPAKRPPSKAAWTA